MFTYLRRQWSEFRLRLTGFNPKLRNNWRWLFAPFNDGIDPIEVVLHGLRMPPIAKSQRYFYTPRIRNLALTGPKEQTEFELIAAWRSQLRNHPRPLFLCLKLYRSRYKEKVIIRDQVGNAQSDTQYQYFLRYSSGNEHVFDGYLGSSDDTGLFTIQTYAQDFGVHEKIRAALLTCIVTLDCSMHGDSSRRTRPIKTA